MPGKKRNTYTLRFKLDAVDYAKKHQTLWPQNITEYISIRLFDGKSKKKYFD